MVDAFIVVTGATFGATAGVSIFGVTGFVVSAGGITVSFG